MFQGHLLGLSWPQEALGTHRDGVRREGLSSRHMSGANTNTQSQVGMQLMFAVVPSTWHQLCTFSDT